MPLLLLNGKAVFFAHIPRTGGSSIEAYMRSKGPLAFYANGSISGLAIRPQHFHAEIYSALLEGDLLKHSFAVMREPLARLQSDYRYRCREPEGAWKWVNKLAGGRRKRVKLGKRRRLLTFDEWAVKSMSRCRRYPTIGDNHIRPQVDFITPGMKVFDFSQGLEPVFRWIDRITETKAEPGDFHVNRSSGTAPDVSDKVQKEIRAFYADDYAMLEPTFPK